MRKNAASLLVSLRQYAVKLSHSDASRQLLSGLALSLGIMTAISSSAQTFRTLATFTDSPFPLDAPLIQGTDGRFYGTTTMRGGDTSNPNILFRITSGGSLTTLHAFCAQPGCTDGESPSGALVQGADGNFYGTTRDGVFYSISPAGVYTVLHQFAGTDGMYPNGSLVQGADGNFYGTTQTGGGNQSLGTIFKISPAGVLTTLYAFPSSGLEGHQPTAGLVQASNGNFYGSSSSGGGTGCYDNEGCGTVFEITPTGTLTTLAILEDPDGQPLGGLALGADGDLYGTATAPQIGAVFEVAPTGGATTLYAFAGGSGGANPYAGLVQGTDGNFYGTTFYGGLKCARFGCGTVFELNPSGTLTTLHDFNGTTDGVYPSTTLMQATNGTFYGTTFSTIFSISTGLAPFVIPQPAFGSIGKKVTILGTNLTGTTAVSFNGTPATFTATGSAIDTTVPTGATSGTITVTTPSGTLSSNVVFTVTN